MANLDVERDHAECQLFSRHCNGQTTVFLELGEGTNEPVTTAVIEFRT